jgi:hypothetical protein
MATTRIRVRHHFEVALGGLPDPVPVGPARCREKYVVLCHV